MTLYIYLYILVYYKILPATSFKYHFKWIPHRMKVNTTERLSCISESTSSNEMKHNLHFKLNPKLLIYDNNIKIYLTIFAWCYTNRQKNEKKNFVMFMFQYLLSQLLFLEYLQCTDRDFVKFYNSIDLHRYTRTPTATVRNS